MKKFLALVLPFRKLFVLALVCLIVSALFNSVLTGLIAPLFDQVMTDQASQTESKAEQLFKFSDKIQAIEDWLKERNFPLEALERHSKGPDLLNPLPWAILVFLVFSLQALFDYAGTYAMGRVGLLVVVSLRQRLIDKVLNLSLGFYKQFSTGEILARINTDVLRVQQAISVKLGEFIKELANCLAFSCFAFFLNWKMSLVLFVLVPLTGTPIAVFTRKIRKYSSKSQTFLGALNSHLKEVLVGIRIVKGFQNESFESDKLRVQNRAFLKYSLRELKIVALTTPLMGMIGILIILTFICYGSAIIQSGTVSRGQFLLYLLVVYQLYQPIKRMARANSEIQQAVGVLPRIEEILAWDNEILEPPTPKRFPNYPRVQEIAFNQVDFHYENENRPVLSQINLTVRQGTVLALVGASGSGKSTLVNLLPRFYDAVAGTITIDGMNIKDLSKKDLRALVAIVTQDTILFDDTVYNNICYGLKDIPQEKVIRAAQQAFAHQFIETLPQGYQTMIGESGSNLSGGQRQRISIARAFLKEAPLLILDEATSALDTESEREVQLALENLMKSRTTFVIAHRLSTIRQAHEILVLERGRIVERGTHDQLLARDSLYRRLNHLQEERTHDL